MSTSLITNHVNIVWRLMAVDVVYEVEQRR